MFFQIICYVCPISARCPNGGPPRFASSAVTSEIVLTGIQTWNPASQNSVAVAIAASLGLNPWDIEFLSVCDSATQANCQSIRRGIRRRLVVGQDGEITIHDISQRDLLQLGGLQLTFRIPAAIGNENTVIASINGSDFTEAVSLGLQLQGVPITAAPTGNARLEASRFVGESFELTSSGAPKLLDCESGYLLVNNTINTQECLYCRANTYSISPFDRCSRRKGYCEVRECYPCSIGAECRGGNSFEPLVARSQWEPEYIPEEESLLYRIQYAPPGYIMIRGENPQDDQVIGCSVMEYSLEPGVPGGLVMYKPNIASYVEPERLCLPCPKVC
eukprot:1383746-Rhodomonas_salina.3